MVTKFKPTRRDLWDKKSVRLTSSFQSRNGLVAQMFRTSSSWRQCESRRLLKSTSLWRSCRQFCGVLVDNSSLALYQKGSTRILKRSLDLNLLRFLQKNKTSPPLLFAAKTRRSKVNNVSILFYSAVESIQASETQSQYLQLSLVNEFVSKQNQKNLITLRTLNSTSPEKAWILHRCPASSDDSNQISW